jgi:protein SCO1/2
VGQASRPARIASKSSHRLLWPASFLVFWPAFILAALLSSCSRPPLPILGSVPSFQLTAQSGRTFDSRSLAGHVWVADFIYTTCPGPCPMMSSRMNRLQTSTAAMPDVKLVSFTVDPEHDTPPVLAEYGKHFKADPARWSFLTGDKAVLNNLGLSAFHLNSVDGSLIHSTRFALVDRAGLIRGYYSSEEDDFLPRLLRDLRQLEASSS